MIDYQLIPSPCYLLEESKLRRNLELLDYVQKKSDTKIIVALKGYSMWSTFPIIAEYLPGATASSLNEALLAKNEMKKEVHLYAPLFEDHEIDEILSLANHISFNSFSQWKRFKEKTLAAKVSPGLRVNPEDSSVSTDLYNPCGRFSRLGITLKEFDENKLEGIEGLHFHALCEENVDALEKVLEAFESKFSKWIPQMKWVNFGGGHHITREDYNVERLIQILIDFKKRYPQTQVILEPGEAVGWQTGDLIATVGDIVKNEMDIAILNISVSAHMPDCLEMPYRPEVQNAALPNEKTYTYRLAGNTCLAGDVIGDYSFDKALQVGDRIVFKDMIHYTMVKTTFFNGVRHPNIGIWTQDNQFRWVRQFTYEQFRDKL